MGKAELKRSRKIKQRTDPAVRLGRSIGMPEAQILTGDFTTADVANRSEADQRDMESLKRNKTIQRKPKLYKLLDAKVIDRDQLKACEWYAAQHEMGFEVGQGTTANYGGAGGGGCMGWDHFPRHKAQMIARQQYLAAREAIPNGLLSMFEKVVLHGRPMGRLGISFRHAVGKLQGYMSEAGVGA